MKIGATPSEQIANGEHVSLDFDRLAESIEQKLNLRPFSDKCSIYRVPKRLRDLNEKAYTPQLISIGPLHYGKEELKDMEEHKRHYLMEFLKLSKVSVKDFIAAIAERETRLRDSYAETFENIIKEEFIEMVLLDCSFVIMFLLKRCVPFQNSNIIDRIFTKPCMYYDIRYDLILLENQLPFFILEDLLKLSEILDHETETEYSMIKLTYKFLHSGWDMWVPNNILEQINSYEVYHFVDFLRICQLPTQHSPPKQLAALTAPTAAELRSAGIMFKFGYSTNLLDMKFDVDQRTLEIPRLKISDQTEHLFRNLQAFEQCNDSGGYVEDYITMLFLLVRAAKDVDVLVKYGIVENLIGDNDAVSRLLKNLAQENRINFHNFYFTDVVEDMNKYYRKRRNKWKAALKQKYFHNPWTIISVVAAGILLILTVIQTVCSILQVK